MSMEFLECRVKAVLVLIAVLLTGCSISRMRTSTDLEVYRVLDGKSKEVSAERIPWEIGPAEKEMTSSAEPVPLTLKDALIVAARDNYDYRRRKEDIYLEALDLSSQRYQFRLRRGFGGGVSWESADDEESVSGSLDFSLIKWLAQGARITFDISEDFQEYLSGDGERTFQAGVSLDIFQPLFRGAGRRIAQENLLQAEREMVYEIRSFLRYQRSFSVDVARKYLALLLSKDNLQSYWNNYLYLKRTTERIEMLSRSGRIPPFEADQAKQNEYRAYQRWLEASNSYQRSLDEFKIFLAFSLETEISPDEKALETLLKEGLPEIEVELEKFKALALGKRLDLITNYDEVEDSERKVNLALNELRTKLDLNVNINSDSPEKSDPTFDLGEPSYKVGLDLEFPVDKIPERNAYREAVIALEREKRNLVLKKSEVKQEVINSYRGLQESYETYGIQKKSLELGAGRVESADLLLQAGRATTRDLLEAQESYLNARISLANSVVDYWISYLEFLKDSESLELDDRGIWKGDLYEKISGENYQE